MIKRKAGHCQGGCRKNALILINIGNAFFFSESIT